MSSNEKEIETKAAAKAEGKADNAFSLEGVMKEVKSGQSKLPDFNDMKKKYRPTPVANKSGFKLREENAMIMNGTVKVVDGTNALLPAGFKSPKKGGHGA